MNTEAFDNQGSTNHDRPSRGPADQAPADQAPADQAPADQAPADQGMGEYLKNEYDYQALRRGDIREGVIVKVGDQGLVVDIGSKREGLVPSEDLSRLDEETRSDIQPGKTFHVFVLRAEGKEGYPILSIHQARLQADWLRAKEMMESNELYEGEVAGYNRGGLIVRFGKIRGFIPASQVVGMPRRLGEEQRRQRLAERVGQQVGLKIIEVDRHRRRLIFSQRRARRAWQKMQRERLIADLTEGETRHGTVTSITNFGAFVDLGGADGLIHISELSWKRVKNPRQVLKVGDEVDVYVLNLDRKRQRIALSLKRLQPDPWTVVEDHYRVGQLIEGRVTRVLDFGAFIELDLGIEGLLHVSEMIGTPELNPSDIVHPDEELLLKVIRIESQRRRIGLSSKQVRRSEWERWMAEQQKAREAEEAAAREKEAAEAEAAVDEAEEAEAPAPEAEAEAATGEAETPAPEAEAEAPAGEADEEKAAAPEVEVEAATGEAETPASEAEAEAPADEADEEETAAPEPEAATGEAEAEAPTGEADEGEAEEAVADQAVAAAIS